ncbi:MAG: CBS domain-containing protein [Chloroflexi bacterium]|nr:CBS domain-containing protein [Chloroflexota bacterium]
MRQYLVREVMSQPAIVIRWDATILEASALMESESVRRLPVVDEKNRVVGIISLGDVREATSVYSTASPYAPDHDEILLAVDEVMSAPVHTVMPDDSMERVVRMMLEHKIGGIPVVDAAGQPLGMVTESDVFRLLLQAWKTSGKRE